MTRLYAIAGSALAAALINVFVASAFIIAVRPEATQIRPHDPAPLYRLSPIPAGADWGRS